MRIQLIVETEGGDVVKTEGGEKPLNLFDFFAGDKNNLEKLLVLLIKSRYQPRPARLTGIGPSPDRYQFNFTLPLAEIK